MNASRCAVLGLDGVPREMLLDLTARGVMPACSQLLGSGKLFPMRATLPEISSVSWTSFSTGRNAGHHGIFGFIDLEPGTYRLRFPDSRDLKTETLFHRLGRQGRRSVVINLPGTYPARTFPGVLVCGFVALELEKAVFPPSRLSTLREIGYKVDVDATKGSSQNAAYFSELCCGLGQRRELLRRLWREEKWDVFMLVVTETDRLMHFFFDAWLEEGHEYHEAVLDFFRQLDELIGEYAELVHGLGDCPLFMLSDHGFYRLRQEINLNPILREAGFGGAVLDSGFEGIVPRDRALAFALDPSRIFVHDMERFPDGRVAQKDVSRLRDELRAFFLGLKYQGEPCIAEVFLAEEVYDGPETPRAADLILLPRPGFDLKGGLSREAGFGRGHFTGMHGYDNAFFYSSDKEQAVPADFSIERAFGPMLERLEGGSHG
jgi:predicted AlkP superfamily phosphohydrolase/phosphomutase